MARAQVALCVLAAIAGTPVAFMRPAFVSAAENTAGYDFESAADYSTRNKGLAVIVMIDGEIVFERYDNGHSPDRPVHIASATKSFWGPAIAAMIDDGIITGYDERIADTITEWKSDSRKSRVTLRHLLTLSSGLRQDNPQTDALRQPGTSDKYEVAVEREVIQEPGKTFMYGPNHYYVLGAFMKRKLAGRYADPLAYLKARILDPIGVTVDDWDRDPTQDPNIPNGAHIKARDWVNYGRFVLQLGEWNGRQIVSRERMAELFQPSAANAGYGMTWWLNRPDGEGSLLQGRPTSKPGSPGGFIYPGGLPDLAMAAGQGRNKLYVVPSLHMVVVRQATGETLQGLEDWDFLGLLLTGTEGTGPEVHGRPALGARSGGQARSGAAAGRGGGARSLDQLDRDGDGKVSRSEIPAQASRLLDAFDSLDRDGDGALSADEIPQGGGTGSRRAEAGAGGAGRRGGRMSGSSDEAADGDRLVRVSPPGASYIDPEFLQQEGLAAFGEGTKVWIARMDPHSGDFVVEGGREYFLDDGMAPLGKTFSGPEFGVDSQGWLVTYDKEVDGSFQLWSGTVGDGKAVFGPVTSGGQHQTGRASKDPSAPSTRFVYIRGTWQDGVAAWIDETEPTREHDIGSIETGVVPISWIGGTRQLVSSIRSGSERGQLEILDTDTGKKRRITDDAGDKTDPYGWHAPEYHGDLLVVAVVDERAIAIYHDAGKQYWERIATLDVPAGSSNHVVGSAEPFTVGARSYLSLNIKSEKARIGQFEDGEIWVFGIDDDPDARYAERCDGGKRPVQRFDPEIYVGDEAFIYYNVLSSDRVFEMWRCRTGLEAE